MTKRAENKSRKSMPPAPSYMSNEQFGTTGPSSPSPPLPWPSSRDEADFKTSAASYLSGLRAHRTERPGGARPQPAPCDRSSAASRYSFGSPVKAVDGPSSHQRTPSQASSVTAPSISSRHSVSSQRGRDYYPPKPTPPLNLSQLVPTTTYMERGQRWMEKEEAVSLREAMEELDIRRHAKNLPDEDQRLYNAALNEAAELVWQHQHGTDAQPSPDGAYRYRPHLRRNSYAHARTASVGIYGHDVAPTGLGRDSTSRSVSGSSADSADSNSVTNRPADPFGQPAEASPGSKSYEGSIGRGFAHSMPIGRRFGSAGRNISGEVNHPFSGEQIWEEPEAAAPRANFSSTGRVSPNRLSTKTENLLYRGRHLEREEGNSKKSVDRVEIHRNPPSQSRDPQYTTNSLASSTTMPSPKGERKMQGMEVRGQDIRTATSMKLSNRSRKLPEPTAVSDSPGRPIVSFDANWRAPDECADAHPARPGRLPAHPGRGRSEDESVGLASVGLVEDGSAQPRRSMPSGGVPTISIDDDDERQAKNPLPTIKLPTDEAHEKRGMSTAAPDAGRRSLPLPGAPARPTERGQRPRGHWSPAAGRPGRATATCHQCGLAIEGRFVALAGFGERFHPQCFRCYSCGTGLEAMEISPEPEAARNERVERIRRREAGEKLEEVPGMTVADDGDDRLRFYCHLDWHELFAPRCKHCKTPILGEHIVALGEHWHYGHFFCAECGDPFEHGATHIEKDGYAWCVGCQTKRTERRAPKCRQCRTAVIGHYIKALGGEWHEHCFRCAECRGGFDDGQIFPKEIGGATVVLCTSCRTRELKS